MNIESEKEDVREKIKRILSIASIALLAIAVVIFVLSYHSVPSIKVTPNHLDFKDTEKEKSIVVENRYKKKGILGIFNFGIFNFGDKPSTFIVETGSDSSWISVDPTSGAVSEGQETISVKIDRTKVSIGSHKGSINIKSNGGDKTVTLLAKRGEDAITITTALANTALDIGSEVTLNWDATIGVFDFVNIYCSFVTTNGQLNSIYPYT